MIRSAAADHHALEEARVVRGCEKARRRPYVGSDHMRLLKSEGRQNLRKELAQCLGGPEISAALRKTEGGEVHGDDRPQRAEHITGRKESQDAFGQRTEEQNRIPVLLPAGGKADLKSINRFELCCVKAGLVARGHPCLSLCLNTEQSLNLGPCRASVRTW